MSNRQSDKLQTITEEKPSNNNSTKHSKENPTNILINTKHLQKAIASQRQKYMLPPIIKRNRYDDEEVGSLLGKFVEEVSTEIYQTTNDITHGKFITQNPLQKTNSDNNETEQKEVEDKILPTDKSTFLTENLNYVTSTNNNTNLATSTPERPSMLNLHSGKKKATHMRLRTYQPFIDENWKFKAGLTLSVNSNSSYIPILMGSIEYQSKAIEDQTKLLFDNILYFKQSTIHQKNFVEGFRYMSLKAKVKMNKAIEETCGILLLLPQLLLLEFYHFIEKFESVHKIDKDKLRDKYITDEDECFNFNAQLLTEMMDFFKSCLEVYRTLVKEVDNMMLKPKKFENVITILEKARFNISSVVMRANNAIKNYDSDLGMIEKMLKVQKKEPLLGREQENLTDKMRNQFIFKKNDERQRIIRINNILRIKKEDLDDGDKQTVPFKENFKSIVNSKLLTSLIKYCKKDVQKQIISSRILSEFESEKAEKNKREIVSLKI